MMDEQSELEAKRLARSELREVVRLLKRARISQNAIARTAGYSAGYVTQLLSDNYPVEKLSPPAIASLTKAASGHARVGREGLNSEEAEQLDLLLQGLTSRYSAEVPQIFGLDGDFLNRRAANFVSTYPDRSLLEDLNEHVSFGVVQVTGAPGQGKTWTLANIAIEAERTHDVCWMDFGLSPDTRGHALCAAVHEIRKAHQRYYGDIARYLTAAGGDHPATPAELLTQSRVLLESAGPLNGATGSRLSGLGEVFTRVFPPDRIARVRRPSALDARPGHDDAAAVAYVLSVPTYYSVDDLADELSLLVALAELRVLLRAAQRNEQPGSQPRKLLMIMDNADRRVGLEILLQMLRELQPLTVDNPALRGVLVVLATPKPVSVDEVPSSSLRRWYVANAFTSGELHQLACVLLDHGWLPKDWLADVIVQRCVDLGGRNRRVSCLYLDHCHSVQELCTPAQYRSHDELADPRLPGLVSSWSRRVMRALPRLDRRIAADVQHWLADVARGTATPPDDTAVARELRGTPGADLGGTALVSPNTDQTQARIIDLAPPSGAREFLESFGLVEGSRVPVVQQMVCRRILDEDVWPPRGRPADPALHDPDSDDLIPRGPHTTRAGQT